MLEDLDNLLNPSGDVSDDDLEKLKKDDEVRKTCEDVILVASAVRKKEEKIDVQDKLRQFKNRQEKKRKVRRNISLTVILTAAAVLIGFVFVINLPHKQNHINTTESLVASPLVITDQHGHEVPVPVSWNHEPVINLTESKDVYVRDTIQILIPYGQSCTVELSDGSRVYLHPGSRIVYPNSFYGKTRDVELEGEAYFSVKHDADHPFRVKTGRVLTTVLGTEFNITSSPNDLETIVLISGKVGVRDSVSGKSLEIVPGAALTVDAFGNMSTEMVDTTLYTSWRDGYFYFDNTELGDILQQLCAYYNVSYTCDNKELLKYRMHFIIRRDRDIHYVVNMLNKITKVRVTIQDRKLIVN